MLSSMKRVSKISMLMLIVFTLLLTVTTTAPSANAKDERELSGVKVVLDGKTLKLDSPLHMLNGRLYLPVSEITSELSAALSWDNKWMEATITTKSKDTVVFGDEVPTVYFNDQRYVLEAAPYIAEGRMYVPVRYVSEFLHAKVYWDDDANELTITSVPLEVVSEDNTLEQISARHGLTMADVVIRNGFSSKNQIENGMKLAVIIPSVLKDRAKPFTETEYQLLAKLVQVESGYESYEGQLAVANVILNRVASSKFPDSIKEVIYSGKQFPPAHNGLLDRSKPNESVLKATKDALNGKNNVPGAVYFYNPKYSKGAFWDGLTTVAKIGNHVFAK